MFGIQPAELIIILIVALIVLGPDRLPGAMRSAGRTYRQVRTMLDDAQQELAQTIDFDPDPPVAPARHAAPAEPADAGPEPAAATPSSAGTGAARTAAPDDDTDSGSAGDRLGADHAAPDDTDDAPRPGHDPDGEAMA